MAQENERLAIEMRTSAVQQRDMAEKALLEATRHRAEAEHQRQIAEERLRKK